MRLSFASLFSLVVCVHLFLTGCSPTRFFYYPNRTLYVDPVNLGMPYDVIQFPSLNGKNLYAIFFKTNLPPKGTVVHFHGNFGNVSNHFMQSQWLTRYGFDVLVVDYQGFGGSEGSPSPKNTVEDGIASVRYAQNHLRDPNTGVVVFGQSMGAAVATVVTAREPFVKGVVLEAGFNSYRAIARTVLKKSFLLWPLYPVYPFFVWTKYDPEKRIADISPRPVLIVHGDKDHIVPEWMSERLYKKAREPKTLHVVPGADHLEILRKEGKGYETRVANFFLDALTKP